MLCFAFLRGRFDRSSRFGDLLPLSFDRVKRAPSSVEMASVRTSPQTRPVSRISTFLAVMLPRTAPATMMDLVWRSLQLTLPVGPMTRRPLRLTSPSNVPSMRTPPSPEMRPVTMMPSPMTEVMRSMGWENVFSFCSGWSSLLLNICRPYQSSVVNCTVSWGILELQRE